MVACRGRLSSLAEGYVGARRMEESNSWRNPVDLVQILEAAFEQLPDALESGRDRRGRWEDREELAPCCWERMGKPSPGRYSKRCGRARPKRNLGAVAYAAALRIVRFPTTNEFGDWDTSLHTFTFSNAVHQGLRRTPSPELLRGVFDAAMSVHLDRFLNVPLTCAGAQRAGSGARRFAGGASGVAGRTAEVDAAGNWSPTIYGGGDADRLLAVMGGLLLREDRNFHTIQAVEAAFRQYGICATPR